MTLKVRAIHTSAALASVFVVAILLMGDLVMMKGFSRVEEELVETNISRVEMAIEDKMSSLNEQLSDWATWDDTYKFIIDKNEAYKESNLNVDSLQRIGVDRMLFIGEDGALVEGVMSDGVAMETADEVDNIYQFFATGSSLVKYEANSQGSAGLLLTVDGLMLYAVQPILTSKGDGPVRGVLVFGKYISKEFVDNLARLSQLNVSFRELDKISDDDFAAARKKISGDNNKTIIVQNNELTNGYLLLRDVLGKSAGLIKVEVPREVTSQGRESLRMLILTTMLIGVFGAILNYFLINMSFLKRLFKIGEEVEKIGEGVNGTGRLDVDSVKDEIGKLRNNINSMLDKLEAARGELSIEKQKGETIVDMMNVMVLMLDPSGVVKMINRKGCELVGYTREELVGTNWMDKMLPEEEKQRVGKVFADVLNGKISQDARVDNQVLTRDGRRIVIGWRTSVIRGNGGELIATLSTGEDITAKIIEEKEREEYAQDLERLNKVMIGRELKMIELKERIKELEAARGIINNI